MPKPSTDPSKTPTPSAGGSASDSDLVAVYHELLREMAARDQNMWAKVTERDAMLQSQILGLVSQVVDNSSVDRVLVNGFSELSDQLSVQMAPLRSLAPQYTNLEPRDDARLAMLRRGLARADFSRPADAPMPRAQGGTFNPDRRSYAS